MENEGVNLDRKKNVVQNIKRITELLDTKFTGPFGIKFGLDPILGLIPGIGDIVTTCLSLYTILQAYFLGVGRSIILRMFINVLIENMVDMIPILGNLFDFVWKANSKNLVLLNNYLLNPDKVRSSSGLFIGFLFFIFILVATFMFYISILLFQAFLSLIHF